MNVRFGSKADERRHHQESPLLGVKRTKYVANGELKSYKTRTQQEHELQESYKNAILTLKKPIISTIMRYPAIFSRPEKPGFIDV